jgi:hypothetical protein
MRIVNTGNIVVSVTLLGTRYNLSPGQHVDLKDEDYEFIYNEVKKISDLEVYFGYGGAGGVISDSGKATLVNGSVVINSVQVNNFSRIFLTPSNLPITGKLHYDTVINGVSFTVHTGVSSDNSDVDWMIIN